MAAWLQQMAVPTASQSATSGAHLHLPVADLFADRSGALFWPDENMLIVADLHFEKGSSFARFRTHLPPYDTSATLAQLRAVIEAYQPERVIALGDSVHDRKAWTRMSDDDRCRLTALCTDVQDWVWIAGNHDPDPPVGVPGRSATELTMGAVVFRHEPGGACSHGTLEVSGHLHPAARVVARGGSTRRPAFATDGRRLILPAFGAYAGGLCLSASPFRDLFDREEFRALVCGRTRVFTVPGARVIGWQNAGAHRLNDRKNGHHA